MKNILTILLALVIISGNAQDLNKFKRVFFKTTTEQFEDFDVIIEDALAVDESCKFKMRIKNKSPHILILRPHLIEFMLNGVGYKPMEKDMIVAPFDEVSKVINVGASIFRTQEFQLKLAGFNVAKTAGFVDAPSFKLPVSQNYFEVGDFKVTQVNNEKKTDVVVVKFSAQYQGNDVGVIYTEEAALKFPNGSEFANMKGKGKPIVLERGATKNFTTAWTKIPVSNGDAQFANLEILWRKAFNNAKLTELPVRTITMQWDPALIAAKK
jgi:hypothetical protein